MRRINVTNAIKLIKKFKAILIRESVLIKHLRNPIQDYPYLLFTRKIKYNEDNALVNRREGSVRNPKQNEKLIGFILGVLFKDKKETLASLIKILNNNFGAKVSEKTINRVLHAHNIELSKLILRPKFDERIKKSRIEFCKYYFYIVDNARYVYTDESHYYTKNPYS